MSQLLAGLKLKLCMVKGDFENGEYDYVSFKVIWGQDQGQGQNSRSLNNPYFEVLILVKSWKTDMNIYILRMIWSWI